MYRRNLIVGVIASACFGIRRASAWPLVTRQQVQRRMLHLMDKLLRPQLDPVRQR